MTRMKFRELIDTAIGSPDPGHVNFSALHCLLSCIADKLGISDEDVNFSTNKETETHRSFYKLSECELLSKSRLPAGRDPEQDDEKAEENETLTTEQKTPEVEESPDAEVVEEKHSEELAPPVVPEVAPEVAPEVLEVPPAEGNVNEPETEVLSPAASKSSTASKKSGSSHVSLGRLEDRISKIEVQVQERQVPDSLFRGLEVMKDQLELAIEQLLLLTFLTLSKKADSEKVQQLYAMAQTLHAAKNENTFIDGCNCIQLPNIPELNWESSTLQIHETLSENDVLEAKTSEVEAITADNKDNLETHLCYAPDKLLDQLMELKSEFCLLSNKVNELSARLLEHESQRTLAIIYEIQKQLSDLKSLTTNLKEQQARIDSRLTGNLSSIDNIKRTIGDILVEKVDKNQLEMQLADKVDYKQLQRKVSLDQMFELQCRIDKRFCEILRQITENDKKFTLSIDNIRETLGFAAIEGILKTFKDNISKDVKSLQDLLKSYIDSTNDECAAAGARIKVLQDLACLSCDTTCVMRSMEKAKVGKLPSAHASNILSPLITYELGSIRKSGIMGYYRKDEFPHATNAWLERKSNGLKDMKQCVPRHAGGEHTVNSAKDRVDKVMLNKK